MLSDLPVKRKGLRKPGIFATRCHCYIKQLEYPICFGRLMGLEFIDYNSSNLKREFIEIKPQKAVI
jgi:hypothetical protein